MAKLPKFTHPNLIIGSENYDDAGVYKISEDLAIIQTVDFFTPIVDDPYIFGQIAATNALSDIYAMGGTPITAMNIACFPAGSDANTFEQILLGGAKKLQEAGVLLIGGHTVEDTEPKYGLAVTGVVHPQKITANKGGKAGDLLFYTKKLGTGILSTALKGGLVTEADLTEMIQNMTSLNDKAAQAMVQAGCLAATDITGFGFLGHLFELVSASGVGCEIWAEQIPVLPQVKDFAVMGIVPGGAYRNRQYLAGCVKFAENVPQDMQDILFDPQTSGGLLMAIAANKADDLQKQLAAAFVPYAIVGKLTNEDIGLIKVKLSSL